RGRGQRKIDNAALFIAAHDRPDIRAAARLPGIAPPTLVTRFTRMWNRVETPHRLPCACVKSSHVTAGPLRQAVRHCRTGEHQVPVHYRRRSHAVKAIRTGENHASLEIDVAVIAEAVYRLAVLRV